MIERIEKVMHTGDLGKSGSSRNFQALGRKPQGGGNEAPPPRPAQETAQPVRETSKG